MSKRIASLILALMLVCVGVVGLAEETIAITYKYSDADGAATYPVTAARGEYTLLSPEDCGFTAPEGQAFDCWQWYMQTGSTMTLMDMLRAGDTVPISNNSEIIANWYTPGVTCTISFDLNGGKVLTDEGVVDTLESESVEKGCYAMLPPAHQPVPPTEEQAFSHWDVNGTPYAGHSYIKVTGDMTVKAIWSDPATLADCVISFRSNGGSGTMENAVVKPCLYTLPECSFTAPEGQHFKAWRWMGSEYKPGDQIRVVEGTSVSAVWEEDAQSEEYTVTFDLNGMTGDYPSVQVESGATYTLPEPDGIEWPESMEFNGWMIDSRKYGPGQTITVTSDITVVAQWKERLVSITYLKDDGGELKVLDNLAYGTEHMELTPEELGLTAPEGYAFNCWQVLNTRGEVIDETDPYDDEPLVLYSNWMMKASWTPVAAVKYTITFDANGGEGTMDAVTAQVGSTYYLPLCTFEKEGHNFAGWLVNGEGEPMEAYDTITVTGDTELVATWDPRVFIIHFSAGIGEDYNNSSGADLEKAYGAGFALPDPSEFGFACEHHEFIGWTDETNGPSENAKFYAKGEQFVPTDFTILVAQWKPLEYKVTFNPGEGGTGEMADGVATYGSAYPLPECTFTAPEGHEFKAWLMNGNECPVGTSLLAEEDTTITALWQPKTYVVTYDLNGMTGSGYSAVEVKYGETHNLRDPEGIEIPENMHFDGWKVGENKYGPGYPLTVTGDMTVVAQWKERLVSLTYLKDDGSELRKFSDLKYGSDHTELTPEELELTAPEGYEFNCWHILNTRGDVIGEADPYDSEPMMVFSDWSLKANWVLKTQKYSLTLDMNGGDPVEGYEVYEGAYFELPRPEVISHPDGLEFDYFDIGDGNKYYPGDFIPATGDVVAVAYWKNAAEYTVTFAAGEGTGSMSAMTAFEGANITLPECGFTAPTGYSFKAWSVGGVDTKPGTVVTVTSNMTVTALYQANLYTVTIQPGEGSGDTMTETMPYDHDFTLPSASALRYTAPEGKSFKGWNVNGTECAAGTQIKITGNMTITALWSGNIYAVLFDANGGTGTMNGVQVEHGTQYKVPGCLFTAPTGYGFKCWSLNGSEIAVGETITVTQSITLKAVWQKDIYTITTVDSNDATNVKTESVEYGTRYTLPTCPYTASQYHTFANWKVESASGTSLLTPGAVITIDSSVKLTAMWDFDDSVQTKIEQTEDISSLPPAEKAALEAELFVEMPSDLKTVEAVVEELEEQAEDSGFEPENVEVHDVKLMFKPAGTDEWIEATKENFPTAGIEVRMPIPEGANATDFDFVVIHMFTVDSDRLGIKAGDTETVIPKIVGNELVFTLSGLSPVSVAYKMKDMSGAVAVLPETGDPSSLLGWVTLLGASGMGLHAMKRRKK